MCNNYFLQRCFDVWIKRLLMAANRRGVVRERIVALGLILYSDVPHPGGMGWGGGAAALLLISHVLHNLLHQRISCSYLKPPRFRRGRFLCFLAGVGASSPLLPPGGNRKLAQRLKAELRIPADVRRTQARSPALLVPESRQQRRLQPARRPKSYAYFYLRVFSYFLAILDFSPLVKPSAPELSPFNGSRRETCLWTRAGGFPPPEVPLG